MKILFLIQDDNMPSSRVRVLNLLPGLEREGIQADVITYPKGVSEKIKLIIQCKDFDAVYVQKKLLSPFDTTFLRRFAKRLIFDFDDAIYYKHDAEEVRESRTRNIKFKYLVHNMDLVITGNRILSDYAKQFNSNVVIIPSSVETRNIPIKDYESPHDRVIIGWVGGGINLIHLKLLMPVLQRLSQEYNIELRILSSKYFDIPLVKIKFIPWRIDIQKQEIALFDIGVMPLPHNKHSEGKCGYKALQYMAAAVPPVVSDVGCNRDILEHGKEGLLVSSIDGFYYAIKALIDDKDKRKEMGLNARKKVEKCFSVHVVGKMLADVLKTGIF